MTMTTEFELELPGELDLPLADQSQPADDAVCDVLANALDGDGGRDDGDGSDDGDGDGNGEVDPTAEQSAPETPAAPSEMVDIVECITDAERDCVAAESLLEDLKDQLKEAKKHYETCVKRLRTFARELERKSHTSRRCTPAPELPDHPDQDAAAESIRDTDQDDIAWRSVPITDLDLDQIKGLGQKKQEALIDLCPTIGDLEDLRARVGRDAASLPELMPRGIGRAACDQIEELLLEWLGRYRQSLQRTTTAPWTEIDSHTEASQAEASQEAASDSDSGSDSDANPDIDIDIDSL